ncbi:hypothetical protein BDV06DRAFT_200158 [Aspergillus oleicola]
MRAQPSIIDRHGHGHAQHQRLAQRLAMPKLTEPIAPFFDGARAEDMSTAVLNKFSSVGRRKQYSTGMEGFCGCTIMYIISRKAVYLPLPTHDL